MANLFTAVRRIVLKAGTGTLTHGVGQVHGGQIAALCAQAARLRAEGFEVIIVSSGAIGLGMGELGLKKRPADLPTLQACAAIGQTALMEQWRHGMAPHGLGVAQLLLTHEDVRARERHLNLRACCERLLELGRVPVVNENDSVSVAEIKFGDNDTLSALVAALTGAQLLMILSTIDGFREDEGRGPIVPLIEEITPAIEAMAGGTASATAVGGMRSKVLAAKVATASGCGVFIGSGLDPDLVGALLRGEPRGTFFVPRKATLRARQRWLAFFQRPAGTVAVDAGARAALVERGGSLLAKGVTGVAGEFPAGAVVNLAGPDGSPFARGRCGYSAEELRHSLGLGEEALRAAFPGRKALEVVHRDALVLLPPT